MARLRFVLPMLMLILYPSLGRAAYGLVPPGSTPRAGGYTQARPLARAAAGGWKQQVGALAPYQARTSAVIATRTGRLVTYPPSQVSIEGLLARRALNPTRFDYHHPNIGRLLARAETYRGMDSLCGTNNDGILSDTPYHRYLLWRRSLNPDRFDHYHPLLGVLLKEHQRIIDAGKVCPPDPDPDPTGGGGDDGGDPGGNPGGGGVRPQEVVPEPSSVVLLAVGMGAALAFGVRHRGRIEAGTLP